MTFPVLIERATRRLKAILSRSFALLTSTDTTIAEFQSSVTLIVMGLILLASGDQLHAFLPVHAVMLHIMSEPAWGLLFLGIGAAQSLANLLRASYGRKFTAFWSAVTFGLLALIGASANPPGLAMAVPLFSVFSITQGIVFLRISVARARIERAAELS